MTHFKETETQFPILDVIKHRWSPRAFEDKAISELDLKTIFEAARWSPSAANEQPWKFIYAHKGSEGFEKIVQGLMPGNQPWAKNAAVLIVTMARKTIAATGKANELGPHDLGMANANIMHQGIAMGIYSHPMAGFDKAKMIELLHINEDLNPIVVIAMGYPASADKLEEPFKSRETAPRSRKPVTDFVTEA